jgi:hypothetical protein
MNEARSEAKVESLLNEGREQIRKRMEQLAGKE